MNIDQQFLATITKYSMLSQGDHVLVGLSGGPDSTCLLHLLKRQGENFNISVSAIYIDHCLRPDETPDETRFCKELCSSLGIPFRSVQIDVKAYAQQSRLNLHEAARELRYKAMQQHALEINAGRIALGHNADDQAETILMRLLRGTGPSGLSGIPPVRGNIIRPLIETSRDDIMNSLNEMNQNFVIDSSNLKDVYTRNRIRSSVMPAMKRINKSFLSVLQRTTEIFRDEERYFEIQVTKSLMTLIRSKTDSRIELLLVPLESMHTAMLRRIIRRAVDETRDLRGIGFMHIEDIAKLIKTGSSGDRLYLPGGLRIIKGYSTVIMTSEKPGMLADYIMEAPSEIVIKDASCVISAKHISMDEYKSKTCSANNTAFADAAKVAWPVIIRHRRPGDSFCPLGMTNRKKLQDFFVDIKVPRDERDTVPLITSNNEIVWVAGYRLDNRFKVEKTTESILKFEIKYIS
ncbi:MAG: tRNA lysidine(34) synthetase TilS [Nitrospiraceae bacterium]|nr:tRNA lysidine(34) synthetase TilS [Nitrospiraceae bacterium]